MIGIILSNLRKQFRVGNNGFKLIIREDGSGSVLTVNGEKCLYHFDSLTELISKYGK